MGREQNDNVITITGRILRQLFFNDFCKCLVSTQQCLDNSTKQTHNLSTKKRISIHTDYTHTHKHTFNGPFSGTTRVSRYQKGKTNLDFTEARDSEWQLHQLGHMQVCTSLQTDNHASTPPLSFYRPDALPAAQPTASKHWRHKHWRHTIQYSTHRLPALKQENSIRKQLTRFSVKQNIQVCIEPPLPAEWLAVGAMLQAPALSSKPAGHHCCCRSMGQTDAQPLYRPCSAYYIGNGNNRTSSGKNHTYFTL